MDVASIVIAGVPVHVSRSGYTGEDGFEISVANDDVTRLWDLLPGAGEASRPLAPATATAPRGRPL